MTLPPGTGAPNAAFIPEPLPKLLRDLVHERTGLYFSSDRLDVMLDKLQPRVAASGCPSFLDYYYILKYEDHALEEWRRVLDAFSVQETYFWREYDQIRALVDHIIPAWFRRTPQPFRIWSAACASGEEPYSIAMAIEEKGLSAYPIEIYASDASESALRKCRQATYRERAFRSLPRELRQRYFIPTADGDRLRDEIAARVQFRWANLLDATGYADLTNLQVIFCRNVFIYFSNDAISRVAGHFAERIDPAGHLFIGASESLLKLTNRFELHQLQQAFAYLPRPTP